MLIKQLLGIMLAIASVSTFAETEATAAATDKTADTTASATDKKTDTTQGTEKAPATDKKPDTTPATEKKSDTNETGDAINISVTTNAEDVAGIGYSVDGKELGGAGSSYTGEGQKNKNHLFRYRKQSNINENIKCGTKLLNKDSKVTLVVDGDACHANVE
jgi:cytoskeletal protein RodZ